MLVSAPLRKTNALGVIIRNNTAPPSGRIREISAVHGNTPLLGKGLLKLLAWMSEYYIASAGLILKQAFPKELFTRTKPKKTAVKPASVELELNPVPECDIADIHTSMAQNKYQTFLVRPTSALHEYSYAAALLRTSRNVIVMLPEITQADSFYHAVRKDLGDRVCLMHSDMSAGRRSKNIDDIISGRCDIVIGTRVSLFAPLKQVSLIVVIHEHSGSFKVEEGVRINIRDCAVMRGFFEKVPVVLTSAAPSLDSWYNAVSGKYRLIRLNENARLPRIKVVNMRFAVKARPYLSQTVVDGAKRYTQQEKRVMFVINRRGHSTMLHCAECGSIEKCTVCGIPMVLHKESTSILCHYCGKTRPVPEFCQRCKSPDIELLGAGTQKIEEDIAAIIGIKPVRFDSDMAKKKSEIKALVEEAALNSSQIIVGTKMMTKRISRLQAFFMAAILNIDTSLSVPDFRAREKAFQDIMAVRDLVQPEGEVIIQTRLPQDPLFRHCKDNNYPAFAAEELSIRKELDFPPYTRLLNILISGNQQLPEKIVNIIRESAEDIEILGPSEIATRKGAVEYSVLLKHHDRKVLHAAAGAALNASRNAKESIVRVDVDPY